MQATQVGGAVGGRGRAGIEQVHGAVHTFVDHLHHAVGEHHQQAPVAAALFETALQLACVAGDRGADVGADHGGGEALELTEHRQDLVGGGHVGVR